MREILDSIERNYPGMLASELSLWLLGGLVMWAAYRENRGAFTIGGLIGMLCMSFWAVVRPFWNGDYAGSLANVAIAVPTLALAALVAHLDDRRARKYYAAARKP